ncbi:MAG: CII family transcriptional regulator [Hydrogenophaga sp.]|uniref:CII family transcriptional regulator n=1 Tax=Hydrogenophaga sp. TaxID=1904254 RepID=UPI003D9AE7AC
MTELSQSFAQKSRNLEAHLMRLIAERTQTRMADAMGVDDSTINRWITSDSGLRRACELLAALGLRLKPDDEPDFSESYVSALETLARHQLDQRRAAR